ncbi:MAG TPA: hypothetical protein VK054_02325, partial [Beutenbergiaceae bacterium]|nr:hypothetical protein [Beutenbergiaceae bacterium]
MAHTPLTLDEVRRRVRDAISTADCQGSDPGNAEAFFADLLAAYGFSDRKIAAFQALAQRLHPCLTPAATPVFHLPGLCLMATAPPHHSGANIAAGEAPAHLDFAENFPIEQAPRWVVWLAGDTVIVHDLLAGAVKQFEATGIAQHVETLGFLAGYPAGDQAHQHRASLAAIHVMTRLHQALVDHGWPAQDANRLLVRMVF